ncbi:hypothetical protein D3C86_1839100 [compost metagenome]
MASGGMPRPVSFTSVRIRPSASVQAFTVIRPPAGVNLMALESRLLSTWVRRSGSATRVMGALGDSTESVTPLRSASNWNLAHVSCRKGP